MRVRPARVLISGVVLAAACLLPAWGRSNGAADARERPIAFRGADVLQPPLPLVADHRYRIVGRLRLLLFWLTNDDIGGARMTWHSDERGRSIALLAGSDPDHAPRGLNEWGYSHEELRATGGADVFTVRSGAFVELAPGPDEAAAADANGPRFNVECASTQNDNVRSVMTTVEAGRGLTYHTFERLLNRIAAAPHWQDRRMPRPAGAQPGFLSALERLMRLSLAVPSGSTRELPPVVYIYKGRVYELRVRPLKALGPTIVRGRKFDRLVSGDFMILNPETKEITKFGVTYPLDGPFAALPVQLTYRPNWWLSVELQLDDAAQVPADPATDAAQLARIRGICAAAQH